MKIISIFFSIFYLLFIQIRVTGITDKNTKIKEVKSYCTSPTPVLSASPSNTICNGSSVTLTASGCNGTIAWNTGASGSTLIVSPTTATTYTATCTESGCQLSLADNISITVKPLPMAPVIGAQFCNNPLAKVWDKRFGGSSDEFFYRTLALKDKGYLLGGGSRSSISGDRTVDSRGNTDFWLVKIDSIGSKIWDKRFGGSGIDELRSMLPTKDKGFLLAGVSQSGISGDRTQSSRGGDDYWIVKIDSLGNKLWDKRYGGNGEDLLNSIIEIEDGGFLLGGGSRSQSSGDKTEYLQGAQDYWVVKIDSVGNKIWDKSFGGSGTDNLYTMILDYDGGYMLGGSSDSGISGYKTEASRGGYDWWIVKINTNGIKQWDKTNGGSGTEILSGITIVNEVYPPRYLFTGYSDSGISGDKSSASKGSNDFWVMKATSLAGNIWDKSFGGDQNDGLQAITPTEDGAYLLGGYSTSGISGDKTEANKGSGDFWLIKMDSTGTLIWDKAFGGSSAEGLTSMVSDGKGGYLLSGSSSSPISGDKSEDTRGAADYWVIKMSLCRDVTTLCEGQNYTLTATGCPGLVTWSTGQTGYSIVVNAAGTYHATCTINDCTSSMTSNIVTVVPTNATLSGTADNGISGAIDSLTSSQTIPAGKNTSYQAGKSINLIESFQAQEGSIFKAEIKACN